MLSLCSYYATEKFIPTGNQFVVDIRVSKSADNEELK